MVGVLILDLDTRLPRTINTKDIDHPDRWPAILLETSLCKKL